MQCPHCGNEVYTQQVTVFNPTPNFNGCNPTVTSQWVMNNATTTMLSPMPSFCAGGHNPIIINSLEFTTDASE